MPKALPAKYRNHIPKNSFPYLAHIRRNRKGLFGFYREYPVTFPAKCAYCGSPHIDLQIEFCRPELNLFHGIGKVSYCPEHAKPIRAHRLYQRITLLPLVITLSAIAAYGVITATNVRGILYLAAVPVFVIASLIANAISLKKAKKHLALGQITDVTITAITTNYIALIVFIIALFFLMQVFKHNLRHLLLSGFLLLAAKELLPTYITRKIMLRASNKSIAEVIAEAYQKFTGVACVTYDLKFYTLGFTQQDYFEEFCRLNSNVIVETTYQDSKE